MMTLSEVAAQISQRLSRIFTRDEAGRRPAQGANEKFQNDPHWRDLIQFYEYFHANTGTGLGASHQTGWTALVAKLLQQSGEVKPRESLTASAADFRAERITSAAAKSNSPSC
jgi:hypothetical protein